MGPLMDNYRGIDADTGRSAFDLDEGYDDDSADDAVMDARHSFGTDERRMHVRAYNFWASLLGDTSLPSVEDLNPAEIEDFGSQSVLLDFTSGMENPAISFLGDALAQECGIDREIAYISDVPTRSLLSRITDHYMQIIANQAPIGFEAEFVNQRGATILYRGILLPFSSDGDTIDFICGVINWKEMADEVTSGELNDEVGRAMAATPREVEQVPLWADGPAAATDEDADRENADDERDDNQFGDVRWDDDAKRVDDNSQDNLVTPDFPSMPYSDAENTGTHVETMPVPDFGTNDDEYAQEDGFAPCADDAFDLTEAIDENDTEDNYPAEPAPVTNVMFGREAELSEWLQSARKIADMAKNSEDRSRAALYQAIGRAYDFSVMAARQPQQFQDMLADSGLTMQDRAPMTPVVKLVFGADYDKTRLTEYAAALSHAHREELPVGTLAPYLESYKGGLKGVVREERRVRRPGAANTPDDKLAETYRRLRSVEPLALDAIDPGTAEFVVLVARRSENGTLGIVGAVVGDETLTDKVVTRITS